MTAFFSTAEQYTAFYELGATVLFTPAVVTMAGGMSIYGGATVDAPGLMSLVHLLSGLGGALVDYTPATWSLAPSLAALGGGYAAIDPPSWSMALTPYSVSAGAMAGTYTDVTALSFVSTAEFSTAELAQITTIVRTAHKMNIGAQMEAMVGARVEVGAVMAIEPDEHGPVARPRAVQGQIVMS